MLYLAAPATARVCCEHGSVCVVRPLPLMSDCEEGSGMRLIGLDVHRDFCEVAVVEHGQVRSGGRISTTPAALARFADGLAADDQPA